MPRGVFAVAACCAFLSTLLLVILLTSLGSMPLAELIAYAAAVVYLSAMAVLAATAHRAARLAFIIMQSVLALFDLSMAAVRFAVLDARNGAFCLARVCIYALILWYFARPHVRIFYAEGGKADESQKQEES